ncbi:MAG: TetR/AcrR family transcriptional regulator [Pseudomonadota bacterium]
MTQSPRARSAYHHGDLPNTLIEEGARLLAESGVAGFSLRKLAQRAGVTVAAPSHHFGSARGVFTAIAQRAFEKLADQMAAEAQAAGTPQDAVLAMCLAYFHMQTTDPGYAGVMFRLDLLDATDIDFRARASHAFGLLESALARAAAPRVAAREVEITARALWATAQGLTVLPMIERDEIEPILRATVAAHLRQLF